MSKSSQAGDNISAENANWSFAGETPKHFDQHVRRSVPFYDENHQLICDISDYFIKPDSVVYELGCATGELSSTLAKHHTSKYKARFIGIDVEADMVDKAKAKADMPENVSFMHGDALDITFESSDLIIAHYTMQFVRPSDRQRLFDKVYEHLNWGGGFLLFEKVRAPDARFQDMMTGIYNEFKLQQGYDPAEIVAKGRSLKGVLEPFSTQGNLDLLSRAGFVDTMSVMKWICFEGFLAVK